MKAEAREREKSVAGSGRESVKKAKGKKEEAKRGSLRGRTRTSKHAREGKREKQ